MKMLLALLMGTAAVSSVAQTQDEVLREAELLYRSEMASWYGTDIFMDKFKTKHANTGGYFSYVIGNKAACVFYSRDQQPMILGTFTFDSTYSVSSAIVDSTDRTPSPIEADYLAIRMASIAALQTDTVFKFYDRMSPNPVPIIDEKGKRVYVLTGPQDQGVVVFGNDYLLTFGDNNQLESVRRLHKNIITIDYGKSGDKQIISSMHSHLPETGDLITATDICTLKLYAKFTTWGQHYVISSNKVSIWDCKKEVLAVMTRDAWDKLK